MTFAAIVHHDIQPDKFDQARERIDSNGQRMAERPGFLARYLVRPATGDDVIVTVTLWASEELYDDWTAYNRDNNPHAGTEAPYVGGPQTTLYDVVSEILPAVTSTD